MGSSILTYKQRQLYDFIKGYIKNNKRSPYLREMQEAFSSKNHKSVIDKLLSLERKGYIKRTPNKHRGIVVRNKEVDKR